jgi:hypothetical protein
MVRRRHGRPIGIADLTAQRGGQKISGHMLFIADEWPGPRQKRFPNW